MTEIAHFIDNARIAGTSGRSQPVFNPATGEAEKTVALASTDEVNAAVASAKTAWETWSKTPPLRRARILDRFKMILWDRADQLAEAISAEHGKTHDDAVGEVTRGLEVVEFAVPRERQLEDEAVPHREVAACGAARADDEIHRPGVLCAQRAVRRAVREALHELVHTDVERDLDPRLGIDDAASRPDPRPARRRNLVVQSTSTGQRCDAGGSGSRDHTAEGQSDDVWHSPVPR